MLVSLHVENYALIEKLDLTFSKGLTVITGETGAGKSILLGALGLVLGQRADNKVIVSGRDKCVSEAVFDIRSYPLKSFFDTNDLEYDAEACIIRRELYATGKSRAFVNDSPVALSILKELSLRLLDIHSQHQNMLLTTDTFPLEVVDILGETQLVGQHYRDAFFEMKYLQSELRKQEALYRKASEEEAFIRFQFDQLDAANLMENEQENLEEEQQMLAHAGDIKQGLGNLYQTLDEEERGIVPQLKGALNLTESLKNLFHKLEDASERLQTAYIDLKDLVRDIEVMFNDLEVNPERLNRIEERLNLLYTLQQKHKVKSTEELISLKNKFDSQLQELNSSDEHLQELRNKLEQSTAEVQRLADALSSKRAAIFSRLAADMTAMLIPLGMPKAAFRVEISPKELDETGQDIVRFLFSSVGTTMLQPIQRIASGGEISRIMLCIKSLIAEKTALPTLLFDEIDTGISGEIAHKMGEIMRKMAAKRQLLCITHLPQIAVQGSNHIKVAKTEQNGIAQTTVCALNPEERLQEIAAMLSGANLSEAAMQNARQLLLENQ